MAFFGCHGEQQQNKRKCLGFSKDDYFTYGLVSFSFCELTDLTVTFLDNLNISSKILKKKLFSKKNNRKSDYLVPQSGLF